MLTIYVDDFKLAGLKANMSHGWKILRQGLHIEPEQRIAGAGAVYLGCKHIVNSVRLPTGAVVTTMTYDMEDFLKSCIERYRAVIGGTKTTSHLLHAILGRGPQGSSVGCSWSRAGQRVPLVSLH